MRCHFHEEYLSIDKIPVKFRFRPNLVNSGSGSGQISIPVDLWFDATLVYKNNNKTTGRRSRKRQIIWFNPPYCQSVETNVARKFLILVDRHFPPDHRLRKIFNRNTLKVSYSCMPNIDSTIKSHNNRLISNGADERTCNCRGNNTCHVEGHCLGQGVIYEATVKSETETKKYVGLRREHSQGGCIDIGNRSITTALRTPRN